MAARIGKVKLTMCEAVSRMPHRGATSFARSRYAGAGAKYAIAIRSSGTP